MVQGAMDDPKTLEKLVEGTVAKFGRIDVLVYGRVNNEKKIGVGHR